jgi:hypothetical protein
MPDDPSQTSPQPLDYHQPTSNARLIRRLLFVVIWLILSGVIIFYLIRMFGSL